MVIRIALWLAAVTALAAAPAATTTTLAVSVPSAVLGQSVVLVAAVSPPDAAGNVTFYDGSTLLGTSKASGGQASLTTSLLPVGQRALVASYAGSSQYAPSSSAISTTAVAAIPSGGFAPLVNYPFAVAGGASVEADFNGDGKADIAVLSTNSVSVLLGNGDGTFQPAMSFTVASTGLRLSGWRLQRRRQHGFGFSTSDGIVVALGNGDGTFQPTIFTATKGSPITMVTADFNGDGTSDIVVATVVEATGNYVSILLGNGDGTFHSAQSMASG